MKIEKLEDGIRFRAWLCRDSNYVSWQEDRPTTKQGAIIVGPAKLCGEDEMRCWEASNPDDDLASLAECCDIGDALLTRAKERKKRRIEITVRFV
jgi:hypothetical protein